MFRIFARHCSQGRAASKAATKITWNTENKKLYGPVVKPTKKTKKQKSNSNVDEKSPSTVINPEPVLQSEMHWMMGSATIRRQMLAPIYDNTERHALKVKHPVEEKKQTANKSSSFAEILKVPLIMSNAGDEESLHEIPELLNYNEVPSVGKILQATMTDSAREALLQWKLSKLEELGEKGFAQLQKDNLNRGLKFHNLLQDYFTGGIDGHSITEAHPSHLVWRSVQPVLREIDQAAVLVEHRIRHPVLRYKGVVDCVSTIGSNLYAIEWKNSEKTKSTLAATFDAPLQLCAYLGAINATRSMEGVEINPSISCGMVVVAYENGRPADSFKLDVGQLNKYWYAWLLRVQEYWIRHRDGTLPEPIF